MPADGYQPPPPLPRYRLEYVVLKFEVEGSVGEEGGGMLPSHARVLFKPTYLDPPETTYKWEETVFPQLILNLL